MYQTTSCTQLASRQTTIIPNYRSQTYHFTHDIPSFLSKLSNQTRVKHRCCVVQGTFDGNSWIKENLPKSIHIPGLMGVTKGNSKNRPNLHDSQSLHPLHLCGPGFFWWFPLLRWPVKHIKSCKMAALALITKIIFRRIIYHFLIFVLYEYELPFVFLASFR